MTDTKAYPFPEGPSDGDVYYHGQLVCQYHLNTNTWECWRHSREDQTDDT